MNKFNTGDKVRVTSRKWADGEYATPGTIGTVIDPDKNDYVRVDIPGGITGFPFREDEIELVEPVKTDSEKARQELLNAYEAYLRITIEKALAEDVAAFAEALDLDLA